MEDLWVRYNASHAPRATDCSQSSRVSSLSTSRPWSSQRILRQEMGPSKCSVVLAWSAPVTPSARVTRTVPSKSPRATQRGGT